jgi:putative transposase
MDPQIPCSLSRAHDRRSPTREALQASPSRGFTLLADCGFTAPIRGRGEEGKALKQNVGVRARRWVVERTHRGMTRSRRVLIRRDKNVRNDLGFRQLACGYLTYRQFGLMG